MNTTPRLLIIAVKNIVRDEVSLRFLLLAFFALYFSLLPLSAQTLHFKSGFEPGTEIVDSAGNSANAVSTATNFIGIDSVTGFDWVEDAVSDGSTRIGNFSIQIDESNNGGYVEILDDPTNSNRGKVMKFLLQTPNYMGNRGRVQSFLSDNAEDFDEATIVNKFYLDPDLMVMESDPRGFKWFTLGEYWTGLGYSYDFRITLGIHKSSGVGEKLYWGVECDYATNPNGEPNWEFTSKPSGFLPSDLAGQWVTSVVYYKKGDASNGRFKFKIIKEDGTEFEVFDITDLTTHPDPDSNFHTGLTKIHPQKMYGAIDRFDWIREHSQGGNGAAVIYWDDFELWEGDRYTDYLPTPLVYDANWLTISDSFAAENRGTERKVESNDDASHGDYIWYESRVAGDFIEFELEVPSSENYSIAYRYGFAPVAGIVQLSVDGVDIGDPVDLYSSSYGDAFEEQTIGELGLMEGKHLVRLTAVGTSGPYPTGLFIMADSFSFTRLPSPEIEVSGNGIRIENGADFPNDADGTLFESVEVDAGLTTERFVVRNDGDATLHIAGVDILQPQSVDFSVNTSIESEIEAGAESTMEIAFDPSMGTIRLADVVILSDDLDEGSFSFAIAGLGEKPIVYDVNELSISDSYAELDREDEIINVDMSGATNGKFLWYKSRVPGDYIEFDVFVAEAGTYEVEYRYGKAPVGGIVQLSIDGTDIGGTVDHNSSSYSEPFELISLGEVVLDQGIRKFRFTAEGTNGTYPTGLFVLPDSIVLSRVLDFSTN